MLFPKKRAIMGIGTLIIFIATILVAAVAAAVLISTSNVLQQRTLLVGQEARKSITNAIEVISILAGSNATTETFNNFEILIRLAPGSDPLQMRIFTIQYISNIFDDGADLFWVDNQTSVEIGEVSNWTSVYDMDGDGINETVRVINNTYGPNDFLQFNISSMGLSENISLNADLSDSSTTTVTFTVPEIAVVYDEDVYGIVSIASGSSYSNFKINASATFTVKETPSDCNFRTLQPEDKFCYEVVNGNNDLVLNSGERFKLLYSLKHRNVIGTGDELLFIFTNEKGRMTESNARTPDVVVASKTKIWPLG